MDDDGSEMDSASASDAETHHADAPVESLVAGRVRRATAGNRLSGLLDQEADDELELLFAEDEEDVEFDAAEDDDDADARFDSSDDDEADHGPAGVDEADGNLEGEKELQRQARIERQAKQKRAQTLFKLPATSRKRVQIDASAPAEGVTTPAMKASKKLERLVSSEGATRTSSRKLTVQNREVFHARIKEHEKHGRRKIAVMEAAAKRRENHRPRVMTQADRLAEAAKTERLNAKSLNRWEATERKRAEEEKERLTALKNRKLEGPVITWWSGQAEWTNGTLTHVGRRRSRTSKAETKSKPMVEVLEDVRVMDTSTDVHGGVDQRQDMGAVQAATPVAAAEVGDMPTFGPKLGVEELAATVPNLKQAMQDIEGSHASTGGGFLEGIHYYASLPNQPTESHHQQPTPNLRPASSTSVASNSNPAHPSLHPPPSSFSPQYSTRNLLMLENFDINTIKDSDRPERILLSKRKTYNSSSTNTNRPQSQFLFPSFLPSPPSIMTPISNIKKNTEPTQELCVITNRPARYRDPSTGLAYADLNAYKMIQRLKAGRCRWSTLLGCYVGPDDVVARGVPERFYAGYVGGGGGGTTTGDGRL